MSDEQVQVPGGHYSGKNKIPTINQFLERLDRDKAQRDQQIEAQNKAKKSGQKESSEQDGDAVPHKDELPVTGAQKKVKDPTSGREVVIEDVDKEMMKNVKNPMLSVPNANLGKDTPVKTDASQMNNEYARNQDVTAPPDPVEPGTTSDVPIHGEKTNILFHPTPSVSYEPYFAAIEKRAGIVCAAVFLAIVVLGKMFGGRFVGLVPLAACITSGIWLWMKEVVRSGREVEWDSEKTRGETATANLLPESVEWMNTFLSVAWGLINPEMFASVADTLEDVMQASVPGIIENVRVAEINQGTNPFRVLSLRALPDSHMEDMKHSIHEQNKQTKDPQEAAADEEGGDAYNLEISFAYHAQPTGKRVDDKARNMHMQLVFYLGVKGLIGIPLPIWVELQELVGTVRLRLMMTPEPPFLKTLSFTLMGVPHVSAGCVPMLEHGVNLLNLPLISNFVNYAIGAASSMYVAPKSMTMDMRAMLQGDDIQKEVQALGVMWIRIHRAVGLSKQDKRGSPGGGSDPYITLTFSKYGKPMYCTRVITDDLNPMWEETAALLVSPEYIKADENLSVELWDSDRHSADDIVGKVELSMQKMIQHPGKMYPQVSKLAGMDQESEMPGELHWEVGYFGKPDFRPALRTDGKSRALDDKLKDKPELQDDTGVANTAQDDAVMHTPPDPLWPSGICSVIIHQIVNLELENIKGTQGDRKGREFEPAKPSGETTDEEGSHLPTSYCTILFNDTLVYRTRAKAVSSSPIFNAGTEQFIRDWRSAIVTVTVRDSRNRQHDPILGVVPLKLSDILDTRSQVNRWYPLDGGIGFGRIRISLLFRSVETRLPPAILGWDVGTFEFTSPRILGLNYHHHASVKLRTGGSVGKISMKLCRALEEGDGYFWDVSNAATRARLPVKYRYRSPVIFEFHDDGSRKAKALAVLWLQHLIDNEDTPINLPIWKTKNTPRLIQNYITEENLKAKTTPGLDDITEVGRLQFRCHFKPGMDESHGAFVMDNNSRETFETWEACFAEGVRTRGVDKETPDMVQKLHDESLTEGRDVLKEADPREKKQWLTKQGTDWSGAFGHDPKAYMNSRGRKAREPGAEAPLHDPINPELDDDGTQDEESDEDLGIQDATQGHSPTSPRKSTATDRTGASMITTDTGASEMSNAASQKDVNRQNRRTEERKQRGMMQWRPARNAKFALDEGKIGVRKLKSRFTGSLEGRQPDVETEA
ncbi:MAG: hypothetical protein Q9159_006164 [Coniocarpon cinnabarinum]